METKLDEPVRVTCPPNQIHGDGYTWWTRSTRQPIQCPKCKRWIGNPAYQKKETTNDE